MRLHKFRAQYWSNTNFAKWCYSKVGVKTLPYATGEQWDEWNETTETEHPRMYWFIETFLHKAQDVVAFPSDVFNTFQTWFRYSFIKHTPIIDSGLQRGEFCSAEELILHGMFAVLVDFVECEKANMYIWCHKEEPKPWWMRHSLTRWAKLRRPDLGIKYLEWEVSLGEDSPYQAEKAQDVLDLYYWWKNIRPTRPDPFEASGLKAYYDAKDARIDEIEGRNGKMKTKKKFRFNDWLGDTDRSEWKTLSDLNQKIEEDYDAEDTKMLMKLVEIRKGLWT